ncbi:hypothetical protein, partial [Bacillus cereus]
MAMDPPYYDGRYETGTPKAIAEKVVVDLPLEVRNTIVNAAIHSSKIAKIYDSYGMYDDAVTYYLESARLWKNTNQSMN